MNTPVQFSPATQALIATAQQAGGDESALQATVDGDTTNLASLQAQATSAQNQLATDAQSLATAQANTIAAFIVAAQSMMVDLGITVAVTVPAPTPPAAPAATFTAPVTPAQAQLKEMVSAAVAEHLAAQKKAA